MTETTSNQNIPKEEQQFKNTQQAIEKIKNRSEDFKEINNKITEYYALHYSPELQSIKTDRRRKESGMGEKRSEIEEKLIKYASVKNELKDQYGPYFAYLLKEWAEINPEIEAQINPIPKIIKDNIKKLNEFDKEMPNSFIKGTDDKNRTYLINKLPDQEWTMIVTEYGIVNIRHLHEAGRYEKINFTSILDCLQKELKEIVPKNLNKDFIENLNIPITFKSDSKGPEVYNGNFYNFDSQFGKLAVNIFKHSPMTYYK